jgi:hypothetical protein
MAPPQVQTSWQVVSSEGICPRVTVLQPGDHGDTVIGMHGIGVNTPIAAAVAEATMGFAGLEHIPNGEMFMIGWKSMMVAAGWSLVITR